MVEFNNSSCPAKVIFSPMLEISVPIPLLFALIFVLGAVGNLLLIIIVTRNKDLQTTPNILILSLAIGDLLLILFGVPFSAIQYFLMEYPFGDFGCRANAFLKTLSLGVSVFTLTALSVERYMAISQPMRSFVNLSAKRTLAVAAGIWVISISLACFDLFAYHQVTRKCGKKLCTHSGLNNVVGPWFECFHASFRLAVYFIIPITIIAVLYLCMAAKLCKATLPDDSDNNSSLRRQYLARRKVATIVLSLVITFVICWLPLNVYSMIPICHPAPIIFNKGWLAFKFIGVSLSLFNSCINPVALCILSDQFRRYFTHYLSGDCCKQEVPQYLRREASLQTANTYIRR